MLEVLLVMAALKLTYSACSLALRHARSKTQVRWAPLPSTAQEAVGDESEHTELHASILDLGTGPDTAVLDVVAAPTSIELTQWRSVELPESCGVAQLASNNTHILAVSVAPSQTDEPERQQSHAQSYVI